MSPISICIDVDNLEKAIEFYTKVLSAELDKKYDEHARLMFQGVEVFVTQKDTGSKAVPNTEIERSYSRHWTPVHIDWKITNSEEAVALVEELGGKHEGTKEGEWGRFDFCSDPFGNGFCLSNMND